MGSYFFKLVLNFLLSFECQNCIFNLGYNNKAKKRHFEERTHYRASGGGKDSIAFEKDGMLLLL
jgi:hypothetical protein